MSTRVVALLRGINVGTAKRVAMADLRALLVDLGYRDVVTLLNSGNAVFTASSGAVDRAAVGIEHGVQNELGVQCRVLVRTAGNFRSAIDRAPLLDVVTDPSRFFVGFLGADPSPAGVRAVAEADRTPANAPDRIHLVGREVYLWCSQGLLQSTLSKINLDVAFGTPVTMRNWKTVTKIAALL